MPSGGSVTATITNTYDYLPGTLTVNKVIAGPAAGSQGPVTIHVACDGTALTPDFDIAAGKPAGTYSQTWTGIPAGSTCTVTEPVNGSTSTVSVTTVGSPQDVTLEPAQGAEATITNIYDLPVGP